MRFEVSTTTGRNRARRVPSSGMVTADSASNSNRNASNSSSPAVHLVDQQHRRARPGMIERGEQRPGQQVLLAEQVRVPERLAAGLGQPDRQQLARVVPLVQRLRRRSGPRSTATGAAGCPVPRPAPWRPRSCRRLARLRAGLAAPSGRPGTTRWPAPRPRDIRWSRAQPAAPLRDRRLAPPPGRRPNACCRGWLMTSSLMGEPGPFAPGCPGWRTRRWPESAACRRAAPRTVPGRPSRR